jgi:hypothetical protein
MLGEAHFFYGVVNIPSFCTMGGGRIDYITAIE